MHAVACRLPPAACCQLALLQAAGLERPATAAKFQRDHALPSGLLGSAISIRSPRSVQISNTGLKSNDRLIAGNLFRLLPRRGSCKDEGIRRYCMRRRRDCTHRQHLGPPGCRPPFLRPLCPRGATLWRVSGGAGDFIVFRRQLSRFAFAHSKAMKCDSTERIANRLCIKCKGGMYLPSFRFIA
jgi:hypothetical protein